MREERDQLILDCPTLLILDAPPAEAAVEQAVFASACLNLNVLVWDSRDRADLNELLPQADVIATWRADVDEAMLRRAGRCLLVMHYGPGAGHQVARVALEAARRLGIYVASAPNYCPEAWVEETLHLLELAKAHGKEKVAPSRRWGVVGLGQVGRLVARQARALGFEAWACDPFVSEEFFIQEAVRRADLATLCGISDVLSLHLPLGPATSGMISDEMLALMKPGALLLNPSDPRLVDLDALAVSLRRARPACAAFAGTLQDFLPAPHPLLESTNHVIQDREFQAWNPRCAEACRRKVAGDIAYVLRGNRPPHLLIDPPCPRHILLLAGQSWPQNA